MNPMTPSPAGACAAALEPPIAATAHDCRAHARRADCAGDLALLLLAVKQRLEASANVHTVAAGCTGVDPAVLNECAYALSQLSTMFTALTTEYQVLELQLLEARIALVETGARLHHARCATSAHGPKMDNHAVCNV